MLQRGVVTMRASARFDVNFDPSRERVRHSSNNTKLTLTRKNCKEACHCSGTSQEWDSAE